MTADLLAQHIDNPTGARHRCVVLDPRRLRCRDCARTIILPTTTTADPPTPIPVRLGDPSRCPRHIGERHDTCGPCRAEQLERTTDPPPFQPTADVTTGAAAARAAIERINL